MMNEQIKELHEQACKLDWEQYPNAIPDGERILQKFAELIIQECVGICMIEYDTGLEMAPQAPQIARQIKQHFGVE